jgi:nucleoside-diphosphate-sugar epimerase
MKTISILGSGWLGLPLSKELSKYHHIKLSTTTAAKKESLVSKNITPYIIDLENISNNIDQFLNCDTLIINIPSKDINSFDTLITHIKKHNIEHIIFISSTSVYKDQNQTIKEEDTNFYNNSPLLDIEKLFFSISTLRTTILRFGGLIGYSRNPANFFKNQKVVKNPLAFVNMIHRDDCIAIIKKILSANIKNEIFNCCSPSHPTKKEFYTHCANFSNLTVPNFDTSDINTKYKIVSSEKLISKLDYKFIHNDLMKIGFD